MIQAKDKAMEIMAELIVATLSAPTISNKQAKKVGIYLIEKIIKEFAHEYQPDEEYWSEVLKEMKVL